VKERQHAHLALGHVEGGASRVRRLDAMVQVKALQQLAEGASLTGVCHGADRGNELAAAPGQVSTDSAGALASQMPSI
jgi:hypothetical protein